MDIKTNPIFKQIGDEVIELQGAELEAFQATAKEMQDQYEAEKADFIKKAEQRQAIANRLGLTADELATLLG
jgi:hypothetical protein